MVRGAPLLAAFQPRTSALVASLLLPHFLRPVLVGGGEHSLNLLKALALRFHHKSLCEGHCG